MSSVNESFSSTRCASDGVAGLGVRCLERTLAKALHENSPRRVRSKTTEWLTGFRREFRASDYDATACVVLRFAEVFGAAHL